MGPINIKGEIERVIGKELSYSEFVERYMEKNQPVVLTGLMDPLHWMVADCDTREFTDQKREEMLVSDFLARCLLCNDGNRSSNATSMPVSYLKDWHFVKEYLEYVAYVTPMFFYDDWLNLYLDNFRIHVDSSDAHQPNEEICCSDYRFVYMGVKGSWTPLHADVFRSYSWNMKNCVYNIFDEVCNSKFPSFSKWNLVLRDYNEAKEYVEDIKDICDDFEGLCQRNLASNTDALHMLTDEFYDFFTFMSYFASANLLLLRYMNRRYGNGTGSSSTISQHLSMNLGCLRKIASEMKSTRALEGNHDHVVDMIKALEDPRFSKLCMHVGKTCIMIHEQSYMSSEFESTSMCDLVDLNDMKSYTSQIYTPEDLIKFIDNGVTEPAD